MTVGYHLMEGWITTLLAKQYNPSFTYRMGVTNAFFCSFYRVATLGSGSGVAAMVYLGENGIEYSKSFGLYMLQYAFHKISIAIFSGLMFLISWNYMYLHYGDYMWLLLAGFAVTIVITLGLILFCCSAKFHRLVFVILDFLNKKVKGKLSAVIAELHVQCNMLEDSSRQIMSNKKLVTVAILLNIVRSCFWYGIPYLIFEGIPDISLLETMAVTSLSVMLAAVIPAPAGIGSTEFVFTKLYASSVGSQLAMSASLLYRFATFVFPFLIGAVIVVVRRIHSRKKN
jgi:uncharacterized protein (TIRG00374 family)